MSSFRNSRVPSRVGISVSWGVCLHWVCWRPQTTQKRGAHRPLHPPRYLEQDTLRGRNNNTQTSCRDYAAQPTWGSHFQREMAAHRATICTACLLITLEENNHTIYTHIFRTKILTKPYPSLTWDSECSDRPSQCHAAYCTHQRPN